MGPEDLNQELVVGVELVGHLARWSVLEDIPFAVAPPLVGQLLHPRTVLRRREVVEGTFDRVFRYRSASLVGEAVVEEDFVVRPRRVPVPLEHEVPPMTAANFDQSFFYIPHLREVGVGNKCLTGATGWSRELGAIEGPVGVWVVYHVFELVVSGFGGCGSAKEGVERLGGDAVHTAATFELDCVEVASSNHVSDGGGGDPKFSGDFLHGVEERSIGWKGLYH